MNIPAKPKISAADIVIRKPAGEPSFQRRLEDLIQACGPECSKNDQATVLIVACIEEGVANGPEIIQTLKGLGFDRQHIAIMLKKQSGPSVERHRWWRDELGQYHLHS